MRRVLSVAGRRAEALRQAFGASIRDRGVLGGLAERITDSRRGIAAKFLVFKAVAYGRPVRYEWCAFRLGLVMMAATPLASFPTGRRAGRSCTTVRHQAVYSPGPSRRHRSRSAKRGRWRVSASRLRVRSVVPVNMPVPTLEKGPLRPAADHSPSERATDSGSGIPNAAVDKALPAGAALRSHLATVRATAPSKSGRAGKPVRFGKRASAADTTPVRRAHDIDSNDVPGLPIRYVARNDDFTRPPGSGTSGGRWRQSPEFIDQNAIFGDPVAVDQHQIGHPVPLGRRQPNGADQQSVDALQNLQRQDLLDERVRNVRGVRGILTAVVLRRGRAAGGEHAEEKDEDRSRH